MDEGFALHSALAAQETLSVRKKKKSEHCNYVTQGIDPTRMYPAMCSGFKYNFGSLGGKSYQNA